MSRVLKFRIWDKANKEYMILGATGLDARNGDILDTPGGRCLCVWNGDGWTYQFKVHKTDWFDVVKEFHENSEVIGNIHENKELWDDSEK